MSLQSQHNRYRPLSVGKSAYKFVQRKCFIVGHSCQRTRRVRRSQKCPWIQAPSLSCQINPVPTIHDLTHQQQRENTIPKNNQLPSSRRTIWYILRPCGKQVLCLFPVLPLLHTHLTLNELVHISDDDWALDVHKGKGRYGFAGSTRTRLEFSK
jgi:hypothetical protein